MSAATSSGATHIPSTDLRAIERVVLGAESPDGAKDGCTGLSQEMLVHLLHETTLPRWLGTYHGEMVANVAQSDQDGDLSPFTPQQTWALRMGTCHRYPRSLSDDKQALPHATVDLCAGFMKHQKCIFRFPLAKMAERESMTGRGLRLHERDYRARRLPALGDLTVILALRPKDPKDLEMLRALNATPHDQDDVVLRFFTPDGKLLHEYLLQKTEAREKNELRHKVRTLQASQGNSSTTVSGTSLDFGMEDF